MSNLDIKNAWTDWPPTEFGSAGTNGPTDIQAYNWIIQIWSALHEKEWMVGNEFFPGTAHIWGQGVAGEFSNNSDGTITITDGSDPLNNWGLPAGYSGGDYFAGAGSEDATFRPTSFDCIISFDDLDPSQQIRTKVISNTAGEAGGSDPSIITIPATLTVEDYSDYVTAGMIDGLDCTNCKFYLIASETNDVLASSLWWGDKDPNLSRWPDYPNDFSHARGTVGTVIEDSAENVHGFEISFDDQVNGRKLPPGKLAGDDLLVYGTDGSGDDRKLYRITIDDNTETEIYFGGTDGVTWVPDGSFDVVHAGGYSFPQRSGQAAHLCNFYTGAFESWYVHWPTLQHTSPVDSNLVSAPTIIKTNYSFSDGQVEADCPICPGDELCDHNAYYQDVWSDFQNVCDGAPDFSYTPFIFKCLGMAMAWAQGRATISFIPDIEYDGESTFSPLQLFTDALIFYFANVNADTSSVEEVGSHSFRASVDSKYKGWNVYYTILAGSRHSDRGIDRQSGYTPVLEDGSSGDCYIELPSSLHNDDDEENDPSQISDIGLTVYYSAGYTRRYPRMFQNLYDHYGFIPFNDTSEGPPGTVEATPRVIDLEESGSDGVGEWVSRPASTNYTGFDDVGRAVEGGREFQDGDVALYLGSGDWRFPIQPETDTYRSDLPWYDYLNESKKQPSLQRAIVDDKRGVAASGTTYSLTAQGKHWWSYYYGGGTLITQSGHASGGSSTTLEDESIIDGTEVIEFFRAARFVGFPSSYWSFILEVDKVINRGESSEHTLTFKVPIQSIDLLSDKIRIHFDSVTVTDPVTGMDVTLTVSGPEGSGEGDTWRIKEPKNTLNRYRGKWCTITRRGGSADGTSFQSLVLYNDDDTLYFADIGEKIEEGWEFSIEEVYPGITLIYQDDSDGAGWTIPTGIDDRTGEPFMSDPAANAPDWIVAYGLPHKLDYLCADNFNEVYAVLNQMFSTQVGFGYGNKRHDCVDCDDDECGDCEDCEPCTPEGCEKGCTDKNEKTARTGSEAHNASYGPHAGFGTNFGGPVTQAEAYAACYDAAKTGTYDTNFSFDPNAWTDNVLNPPNIYTLPLGSVPYSFVQATATGFIWTDGNPDDPSDYPKGDEEGVEMGMAYAYGHNSPPSGQKFFNSTIDYYVYPRVDANDTKPSSGIDLDVDGYDAQVIDFDSDAIATQDSSGFEWHVWHRVDQRSGTKGDTATIYTDKIGPRIASDPPTCQIPPDPIAYASDDNPVTGTRYERGVWLGTHMGVARWRGVAQFKPADESGST